MHVNAFESISGDTSSQPLRDSNSINALCSLDYDKEFGTRILSARRNPLATTTHLNGLANVSSVSRTIAISPTDPSVACSFRTFIPVSVRLSNLLA